MDQKIKIVIIGLVAFLGLSLIFSVQLISTKQIIAKERDRLKQENVSLSKDLQEISAKNRTLETQISSLKSEINKLSQENKDLAEKYNTADKARQELIEKLKSSSRDEKPGFTFEGGASATQQGYWAQLVQVNKELEARLENLSNDLKRVQISNEELEREKISLQLEAKNLERDKEDLKRQLDFAQKQMETNKKMMDAYSFELVGEKNDKIKIQELNEAIKRENQMLRRQVRYLSSKKINLEKKVADLQEKADNLEKKFAKAEIVLKDKVTQLDKMGQKLVESKEEQKARQNQDIVELSPIVVRPQADMTAGTASSKPGAILAVNKENRFVVINLGRDDGIKEGDELRVYKKDGAKEAAVIEVITVRKSNSACDIKKEYSLIEINDIVK